MQIRKSVRKIKGLKRRSKKRGGAEIALSGSADKNARRWDLETRDELTYKPSMNNFGIDERNEIVKHLNPKRISMFESSGLNKKISWSQLKKKFTHKDWYHFFKWTSNIYVKRNFYKRDHVTCKATNSPFIITQSIPDISSKVIYLNELRLNQDALTELAIYNKLRRCTFIPKFEKCFIGELFDIQIPVECRSKQKPYGTVLITESFDKYKLKEMLLDLYNNDLESDSESNDIYNTIDLEKPSLTNYINLKNKVGNPQIELDEIRNIMHNILSGLYECHKNLILHGNLRLNRIILFENKWKLTGFTESSFLHSNNSLIKKYTKAAFHFMPPEFLINQHNSIDQNFNNAYNEYSDKIDIWSAGIIFMQIASKKINLYTPDSEIDLIIKHFKIFGTPSNEDFLEMNIQSENNFSIINQFPSFKAQDLSKLFPILDDAGIDLLTKLCKINQKERISAIDALNHPFFDKINKKNNLQFDNLYFNMKNTSKERDVNLYETLIHKVCRFSGVSPKRGLNRSSGYVLFIKGEISSLLNSIKRIMENYSETLEDDWIMEEYNLTKDDISLNNSEKVRKNNTILIRRVKHTVFYLLKNYINKKLSICKDIDQLRAEWGVGAFEKNNITDKLDTATHIIEQLAVNQYKYLQSYYGADKDLLVDILNTIECDIYPFTVVDFELYILNNIEIDLPVGFMNMMESLIDGMIIRYQTDKYNVTIIESLRHDFIVGNNLYPFSTIAFASFVITLISFDIPLTVSDIFKNIKDETLIYECISDMLNVNYLIRNSEEFIDNTPAPNPNIIEQTLKNYISEIEGDHDD